MSGCEKLFLTYDAGLLQGKQVEAEAAWAFACDSISVGCGKYSDLDWLARIRRCAHRANCFFPSPSVHALLQIIAKGSSGIYIVFNRAVMCGFIASAFYISIWPLRWPPRMVARKADFLQHEVMRGTAIRV